MWLNCNTFRAGSWPKRAHILRLPELRCLQVASSSDYSSSTHSDHLPRLSRPGSQQCAARCARSTGLSTEAVYIFNNMLRKLAKQHDPPYIAAIFESGEATHRVQDSRIE